MTVCLSSAALRAAPKAELPAELELVVAAAPPLVRYPIMGSFDERGRLFVGDAAGLNLRAKDLEAQLPNRVLLLEDRDHDGVFETQSVFADKMTFPQGAAWLDGSLYVASPPGIWKLTDTNGDGVADRREMIVSGFEYDGNAADVHGPFVHPTNGRLYWCHGRKGHRVVQKDGTLVHEGKASGIWSCRPDGSDVQWHALGCMDNPVEIDFTPEGRILGVVNLYYNQPRGDTLVHWLLGGVYERPDQLAVIAGLPRTLERMPVVHNFGHVAVSGFTRYRSGALNAAWRDQLFITYFNTQKLIRVELTAEGATYRATEHEFLKLNDPDAHFTDVIEDPRDGSLLVLDTGAWFRIGCPSSIAEKPDFRGAIYRVRKKVSRELAASSAPAPTSTKATVVAATTSATANIPQPANASSSSIARTPTLETATAPTPPVTASDSKNSGASLRSGPSVGSTASVGAGSVGSSASVGAAAPIGAGAPVGDGTSIGPAAPVAPRGRIAGEDMQAVTPRALLDASRPFVRLAAFEALAQAKRIDADQLAALRQALAEPLEPTLEHAALFAAIATRAFDATALRAADSPTLTRRLLVVLSQTVSESAAQDVVLDAARRSVDASDTALASTALAVLARFPRALERWHADLHAAIAESRLSSGMLRVVRALTSNRLTEPAAQSLVTALLQHANVEYRRTAWEELAQQTGHASHPDWFAPLQRSLEDAVARAPGDVPLLIDAIAKLNAPPFDASLRALSEDNAQPLPIRLRALGALARSNEPLSAGAFRFLVDVLREGPSPTAKVEAARLLVRVRSSKDQRAQLAPLLATVGVVELTELLKLGRQLDAATSELWAAQVLRSPYFTSLEESAIRSAFSSLSAATYESVLGPAARAASAEQDAKRRRIGQLAAEAGRGRAEEGRRVFAASACVACHRAGDVGRDLGPDLSHIGRIRQPRDLLESIMFPSATIARDYETVVIETSDGQAFTGTLRGETAEGVKLAELSGEQRTIPHRQIVGRSTLGTSLMPAGLEQAFTEQQLLDLVAWLASSK